MDQAFTAPLSSAFPAFSLALTAKGLLPCHRIRFKIHWRFKTRAIKSPLLSDLRLLNTGLLKGNGAKDISMCVSILSKATLQEPLVEGDQKPKILLILDLNGVLVRTYPRDQEINVTEKPAMYLRYKKVYFRPGLTDLIDLCLESFEIGIWSCLTMNNVQSILRKAIGQHRMDKLLFIWDQTMCTIEGHASNSLGQTKPIFLKELSKVYRAYPQFGPENTLLIDDSEYKLKNNKCCKYICPESYDPEDRETNPCSSILWNNIIQHINDCNVIPEYLQGFSKFVLNAK